MSLDWKAVDRSIMGAAWIDSEISRHLAKLCDEIGVRWAGTENERAAAQYVGETYRRYDLANVDVETFPLKSWECRGSAIEVTGREQWHIDSRPCLFCPVVDLRAPLIDVGWGMDVDLRSIPSPDGAVALIDAGFEPFSDPCPLTLRLRKLASLGVRAAITPATQGGRRTFDFSVTDWRDHDPCEVPLPVLQTSREDGARLRRLCSEQQFVSLRVDAVFHDRESWNALGEIPGSHWPDECLLLSGHHDTTTDSFGANDNAAGVAVLLEVAKLLRQLDSDFPNGLGRTLRFVSFGAEEQGLQGSSAFVQRHYPAASPSPRLALNLDELATGHMKGVVLQFPELRGTIQRELDAMGDGLVCHVLSQLDASGDMFPFSRAGIPSGFLWRWRFFGRHPDVAFGHSSSDTPDKLRFRELKEYAGQLARLLVRLSHLAPERWPKNELEPGEIRRRLETERGTVFRTM